VVLQRSRREHYNLVVSQLGAEQLGEGLDIGLKSKLAVSTL
jgi:hypothetical protein